MDLLKEFKLFKATLNDLKSEFGNNLYEVSIIKPIVVNTDDVIFAITGYQNKSISKEALLDWVNTVWFTDLFEYNTLQEESIASVLTVLETLDEPDVLLTDSEFNKMIEMLKMNKEYYIG